MAGPLFVSVGKPEQLRRFLELNRELSPRYALVDSTPTFEAYRAVGFNNLLGEKKLEGPPDFKPPTALSSRKWWNYLTNVGKLAPVPEGGLKLLQVPEGVRVLGGTYVLDGERIVFSHEDAVPGATPDLERIFTAAGVRGTPV